jgi:hypothetical protein
VRIFRLQEALRPLPETGPLPDPARIDERSEVLRHLREAYRAAQRSFEEAWPQMPARARVFVGAGLAAMVAVAAAFFAMARMGALP